jgi:hypothetical protein
VHVQHHQHTPGGTLLNQPGERAGGHGRGGVCVGGGGGMRLVTRALWRPNLPAFDCFIHRQSAHQVSRRNALSDSSVPHRLLEMRECILRVYISVCCHQGVWGYYGVDQVQLGQSSVTRLFASLTCDQQRCCWVGGSCGEFRQCCLLLMQCTSTTKRMMQPGWTCPGAPYSCFRYIA